VKGDIALASIHNTTVANGYGQIGTLAALTQPAGVQAAVTDWKARRDHILEELQELPVVVPEDWSLLLDAEALGHPHSNPQAGSSNTGLSPLRPGQCGAIQSLGARSASCTHGNRCTSLSASAPGSIEPFTP
jgi:hypothetical protein